MDTWAFAFASISTCRDAETFPQLMSELMRLTVLSKVSGFKSKVLLTSTVLFAMAIREVR
jgi:hypothetical protein